MDTVAEWISLALWGVMILAGGAWSVGRALYRRNPSFPWHHVVALALYLIVTVASLVIMNQDIITTTADGEKDVNFDGVWLVLQTCLFVGYWIATIRCRRRHWH